LGVDSCLLLQLPVAWDEVASPTSGAVQARKAAKPDQPASNCDDESNLGLVTGAGASEKLEQLTKKQRRDGVSTAT
jgi:hypothetical protein